MSLTPNNVLVHYENETSLAKAKNPLVAHYPRISVKSLDATYMRPILPSEAGFDTWLNSVAWAYNGKSPTPESLLNFHNKIVDGDLGEVLWHTKDELLEKGKCINESLTSFVELNRVSSKWKLAVQFMAKLDLTSSYYGESGDVFDFLAEMDDVVSKEKVTQREFYVADYFGVRQNTMNEFRAIATPTSKILSAAKAQAERKLKMVDEAFTDLMDTDIQGGKDGNVDEVNAKSKRLSAADSHALKIATPIIERLAPAKQKIEVEGGGDWIINMTGMISK